jgi:hypothetical protein
MEHLGIQEDNIKEIAEEIQFEGLNFFQVFRTETSGW